MSREFAGKQVTVMGLGRFGGGVGLTRWLVGGGARVLLTDRESPKDLESSLARIDDLVQSGQVILRLGAHDARDFARTDMVVVNPAVATPWANEFVQAAFDAGVRVTTEIGLLCERLPNRQRTIGVTGSAGKSTTSAMIHHVLKECRRPVVFGGNIGGTLLGILDSGELTRDHWVVLELSSAMLYWLSGWSPHVAVVTNLVTNHVDWHGTIEHYRHSKQQLLASQREGDIAVLGETLGNWSTVAGVDRRVMPAGAAIDALALPGRHNRSNAALAVAAVLAADPEISREAAQASARTFSGLSHRLERVGVFAGIACFNDSKSTTPESTMLALEAFGESVGISRVHLIAGGYDKGADLTPIAKAAGELAGLYTIGQTGPTIAAAAHGAALECQTLEVAVRRARERARPGDVLLLSPACASWGQFENFERRGELFVKLVRGIT